MYPVLSMTRVVLGCGHSSKGLMFLERVVYATLVQIIRELMCSSLLVRE